jgi:DNA-binding HxlR family transcriptional regulator
MRGWNPGARMLHCETDDLWSGRIMKQTYTCGLDAALDIVGGKWKALILWELAHGPHRFGELKRSIPGISDKMLAQQLRDMELHGLVHREIYQQIPPKVEYSLTDFGGSLSRVLVPLAEWGEEHLTTIEEALPGALVTVAAGS